MVVTAITGPFFAPLWPKSIITLSHRATYCTIWCAIGPYQKPCRKWGMFCRGKVSAWHIRTSHFSVRNHCNRCNSFAIATLCMKNVKLFPCGTFPIYGSMYSRVNYAYKLIMTICGILLSIG